MIEKILWSQIGIGQSADLANAIATHGSGVVVIAPAVLHQQWRRELEQVGVEPGSVLLMSPHSVRAKGLGEATVVVVDDQNREGWKLIADQIRDEQRPVWLRVNREMYREIQGDLLPSPEKAGEAPEDIGKTVEAVLLAHKIEPDHSWEEIAVEIYDEYPHLSKWLNAVGQRWEAAMGFNEQRP